MLKQKCFKLNYHHPTDLIIVKYHLHILKHGRVKVHVCANKTRFGRKNKKSDCKYKQFINQIWQEVHLKKPSFKYVSESKTSDFTRWTGILSLCSQQSSTATTKKKTYILFQHNSKSNAINANHVCEEQHQSNFQCPTDNQFTCLENQVLT